MALRVLAETGSATTNVSASVCIVGAGIAGLIAATRLARDKRLRVVVVESGLRNSDPLVSALNEIVNSADKYRGAQQSRFRGLGGTSVLWSGKLLPLTPSDTRPRRYLGLEGWPFDIRELDRYRGEIELFLGVDGEPYEEDISSRLDPESLLAQNDIDISLRWPKRPSLRNHNLAYVFRREIEKLDNLEIWLGATASSFDFDLSSGKIKALTAINHGGQSLKVAADEYLLAAGTLECTRLLLLADRQSNHSISRDCDALGRYFNDHLGLVPATLQPLNRRLTNRTLSDRSTFSSQRHLHFELRPEIQEKNGIASAYCDLWAELPEASSLTKSKQFLLGIKRGKLDLEYDELKALFQDFPSLYWTAHWQWMLRQKYWPPNAALQLNIWVEQMPLWQNRLCLSDQKDALQLPKLKLEWKKTDAEEKTFQTMARKIDQYWARHLAHICQLKWKPEVVKPDSRMVDSACDLAHPAGSTRMGTTPSTSVVDPQLRVHRMPNLSVASASAFPTSGSANPTLTIMQLAMRAADNLAQRLTCR